MSPWTDAGAGLAGEGGAEASHPVGAAAEGAVALGSGGPGGQAGEDPAVRALLEEIWVRPEFTPRTPSLLERLLNQIRSWVAAAWEWIAERIPSPDWLGSSLGNVAEFLVYVLLGVAVLGAGWLVARAAARHRGRVPAPDSRRVTSAAPERDPAAWEARARAAAEAGRFREAALARYRALLLRMARGELLRMRDGRTPGDYLEELRRRDPEMVPPFRGFLAHFHPVAFGSRAPVSAAWEALALSAAELEGRIPQASGRGGAP